MIKQRVISSTHLVRNLGHNDVRLLWRDRFLLMVFSFVLLIAAALRYGMPWLDGYLATRGLMPGETITQRFSEFYPMLIAFMAIFQGALLSGTIAGFMMLDEKEDRTIKALLVSPISINWYVMYRVAMPAVLAFFIVPGMVLFINQALLPLWQLLLVAIGAALTAPISALFYAIFAENKVQGFAISKFVSIFGWVILGGWFVGEPLQWLFGLFPPFLVCKAYWMALDGDPLWWLALAAGLILQVGLILMMIRGFKKMIYR